VDLNVQYAGNNRNNPLKIHSNKQAEKKKYISLNVFFPLPGKMLICLVDLNFIGSKTRLILSGYFWHALLRRGFHDFQVTPRPGSVITRAWLPRLRYVAIEKVFPQFGSLIPIQPLKSCHILTSLIFGFCRF